MKIQILNVSIETKPTTKSSYQVLDLAFKNLTFNNKVDGKKIMSFGASESAFKALKDASPGSVWEITTNKNEKGYIDWTSAQRVTGNDATASDSQPTAAKAAPARSNYETPEERAIKQIYIVRQSSITNAIATLSLGSKALKKEDVVEVAKFYEEYVFGKSNGGASGFDDLPASDIDLGNSFEDVH